MGRWSGPLRALQTCSLETFVKGGGEPSSWDSAFVSNLGPALFDPSEAIVSPALASLLHRGKCGLCSPETFYPSPALVGTSWEGLPGRTQSLAAEGQGPPLSAVLRLAPCVGCTKLSASLPLLQIMLCWGWRENSGQIVSASLKNCLC